MVCQTGGAARGRRFGLDGRLGRGSGLFAWHPVPSPTLAPVRVAIRFNTSNISHICHRIKCRPAGLGDAAATTDAGFPARAISGGAYGALPRRCWYAVFILSTKPGGGGGTYLSAQGTTPGVYPATPPWTLGRKVGSHPTTPPWTFAGNEGGGGVTLRVPPWGGTPGGVPCKVGLSTLNWLLLSSRSATCRS